MIDRVVPYIHNFITFGKNDRGTKVEDVKAGDRVRR